jgi:hypothetical protein
VAAPAAPADQIERRAFAARIDDNRPTSSWLMSEFGTPGVAGARSGGD